MSKIDVSTDNNNFTELVNKVTNTGERILIERQGQEIAAIITYAELKRLEAVEAALIKKAELEEYQWLKAVLRNPAYDSWKDAEEDIYTLEDGKPFSDPEWEKTVVANLHFEAIADPEKVG
jgi:prevent-host-death family protein